MEGWECRHWGQLRWSGGGGRYPLRLFDCGIRLAFSPATREAKNGCRPEPYSDNVTQPLLALRPEREMEMA